jgi:hypothetical protein
MELRQDKHIKYKKGFKYQVAEDYYHILDFDPGISEPIILPFIELYPNRQMITKAGYASDGPSGPTIDTPSFMRGAMGVHDPLYQLLRGGHLASELRKASDVSLLKIILEDDMLRLRARYVYRCVRLGAGPAADPSRKKKIITAP